MSEQASQEPTMEEILASIRRIISEDEPQAEAAAPEPEPAPAPEPEPVMEAAPFPEAPAEEDDVLDLTEKVEAAAPPPEPASELQTQSIGDLDVFTAAPEPAPAPMPAPEPARAVYTPPVEDEGLISAPAAAAATSAFGQLAQRIAMPSPGQTLDDVVRELLRPLLKDWLDRNLPAIVQAKVEEEVERLARRRMV